MRAASPILADPLPERAACRPSTLQAATTAAYGKWGPVFRSLIGRTICRGHPQTTRPGGGEWGEVSG